MGSATELRINLGALKRQDPYIENITDTSTHVAVYSFSPQLNEWEKTDVEGTLFVYRRVAPPYWGFTILNRLSMDNLTEPLTSELEFQTQNPFLLYRNAKLLIYGIWFYDQEDCKRIGELLQKLCRESSKPPDNLNVQKINLFGGGENNPVIAKDPAPKSGSPTSNSVNSVSPGSSVGGVNRPLSNGEADSESEEKDMTQNNKGSIDILDLLSKAQDKYEKEKRNTPDPAFENMQNGTLASSLETEMPLVKPVPVKPSHPQKLDVATLFKQPAKPPDASPMLVANGQINVAPSTTTILPGPPVNGQYAGITTQPVPTVPLQTATASVPQQRMVPRTMSRSLSMNEAAMRKHIDPFMSVNVMSVEEIEAGLNRNAAAVNRQQQVNSTLDRMIDRINSGGVLTTAGNVTSSHPALLPGIQEATQKFTVTSTSIGNTGGLVMNGSIPVYREGVVFSPESNNQLYAGSSVRPPPQTFVKPSSGSRQRSMSSSAMPPTKPLHAITSGVPPVNAQYASNFHSFPTLPLHTTAPPKPTTAALPTIPQSNQSTHLNQQLLLHSNAVISKPTTFSTASTNPSITSITTAVSSVSIKDQLPKVPVNSAVMPHNSKSSPALSATLISPEDFERSASTPQKKLELKQRMLQEVPQPKKAQPNTPAVSVTPLTKEQLQQTLVSLLQKDSPFLTAIHEAYMANFKQT